MIEIGIEFGHDIEITGPALFQTFLVLFIQTFTIPGTLINTINQSYFVFLTFLVNLLVSHGGKTYLFIIALVVFEYLLWGGFWL